MKCRARETITAQKVLKVRQAYSESYTDYIVKAMILALTETAGFKAIRLQRIATDFPNRFLDLVIKYIPDKQFVKVEHQGILKATPEELMADGVKTMIMKQLSQLSFIGFVPDVWEDFKPMIDSKIRRNTIDDKAMKFRKNWYDRTGKNAAIAFTTAFMVTLNEMYGFGKVRLERWYRRYIELHRAWINAFIDARDMCDDMMKKQSDTIEKRLHELNIDVDANLYSEGRINITNKKGKVEVPKFNVELPKVRLG